MAIDFPTSPTLNQTLTSGSTTWRWNGSSWVVVPQTITASGLGLGNVENTALSTWAGSANITTLGTVATGTWNATNIGLSKGGTNASLTATNGAVAYSTASALALTAAGTSGNVLVSNGAAAPSWASGLTLNAQQALLLNPYGASAGNTSELRFAELAANGLTYVGFKAADNIPSSLTWVLPSGDGGKGQYLSTNGAATLSWSPGPYPCQGRLTLSSGVPVPASDVTAATTLYFAPYGGNTIALWNNSLLTWENFNFSQLSLSIAGYGANQNFDVFIINNSGTPTLYTIVWTNNTTRGASALTTQDGVLVLSGDARYRYVGTIRTTATTGQTEDSEAKRYVWNYYNRVTRSLRKHDSTANWTYSTGGTTPRYQNNTINNRIDVVCGEAQGIQVSHFCDVSTAAAATATTAIYYQTATPSTATSPLGTAVAISSRGLNANMLNVTHGNACSIGYTVPAGFATFGAIEYQNTTTAVVTFTAAGNRQGIVGYWKC